MYIHIIHYILCMWGPGYVGIGRYHRPSLKALKSARCRPSTSLPGSERSSQHMAKGSMCLYVNTMYKYRYMHLCLHKHVYMYVYMYMYMHMHMYVYMYMYMYMYVYMYMYMHVRYIYICICIYIYILDGYGLDIDSDKLKVHSVLDARKLMYSFVFTCIPTYLHT